jgi:hypothetical protein
VVQIGISETRVLAVVDLLMGFLGQWWRNVVEVEDEFHTLVVVGIEGVGFGNVAEVGWGLEVVLVM